MELSYSILYDRLKAELSLPRRQGLWAQQPLGLVLPYTGADAEEETLYLAVGEAEERENVIALASPAAVSRVLGYVQEFRRRSGRCEVLAESGQDLQALLEEASALSGFQFMLIDRDYVLQGVTSPRSFLSETEELHSVLPLQALEELYRYNPAFDETFRKRGICPYPEYPAPGGAFYFYNVCRGEDYLCRILLTVPRECCGNGSEALAAALCALIERCYLQRQHRSRADADRLDGLWRALVCGEEINGQEARELLRQRRLEGERRLALRLEPHGYFHSEETLRYYAGEFMLHFPGSLAAAVEGGLFCLLPGGDDTGPFRQKLAAFLRENLFLAGVSNPFSDFFAARLYCQQASDALLWGQKRDASLWRYDFCDYVGDYTLALSRSRYSARDLCPRNLRQLLEYEESHPESALLETLYQYYASGFNAQTAAARLYIHRTTFFYRMGRIREIADFHPDDPRETAQILLALEALREEES